MKKRVIVPLLLIATSPLLVQASCDTVKATISQKIISNGVAESAFSLDVVPNDQAEQAGGQVVGHCENDTQKIIYKKTSGESAENVPEAAGSSQDSSPAQ